jgi:hypothetical protein
MATEFDVPADFPRPVVRSSVAGFQPKLALTTYHGRFYRPGGTPPELYRRWDICEDLAQQFVRKAAGSKAGKRAVMSEVDILDQYCLRAMTMGWGSDDEMRWVFRRVSSILGWPVPSSAAMTANPALSSNECAEDGK